MPLRHANDRECLLPAAPQAEKKIFTSIAVESSPVAAAGI